MSLFAVHDIETHEPPPSGVEFMAVGSTGPAGPPHTSDMAMVPYKTLEELMKPRTTVWTRVHLIILYALLGAGTYFLLTLSTYQRSINNNQTQAIANLGSAINNEKTGMIEQQKRINGITGNLEALANQLGNWTEKTTNHVAGLDRTVSGLTGSMNTVASNMTKLNTRLAAQDQTNASMAARLSKLEMATVPTILPTSASQHIHSIDMSIPMVNGGTQHFNAMNEKDYWIVQRIQGPSILPVRVLPFANTPNGVQVHSIDDGRDYTITKEGQWIPLN